MTESIVEIKDLTKIYKTRRGKLTAVDHVSFKVFHGEMFGMIGPNGAGKSTIFNMMTTLIKPTSGSIKIAGYDLNKDASKIRRIIGVVPQQSSLYLDLTARENLQLMGDLYEIPKYLQEERIERFLKLVALSEHADRYVSGFSGGMKQRLSVICAMMHDPEILFWDEPTTGLDPQTRKALWDLALKLKARGKTLIFTTHYMDEADKLCDRVAIMNSGKLIALDPPDNLKRNHQGNNLEEVFMHLTGEHIRD
ncbi:MAG: ABC transporter ATP-binding protein [Methanosarcinales archaeon]